MDIMRRIDQVIAATADAYVKELQAEIARLREALVDKQARLIFHSHHRPHEWTDDDAAQEYLRETARDYLRDEELLP